MKEFQFSILLFFYLLSIQVTLVTAQGSSISFSPDRFLCNGDVVEMVCFVESSVPFSSNNARVSIDSSSPAFTLAQLNTDTVLNGVDLSRYTANTDGLTRTLDRAGIRVIISSYQPSDSNTVIGCHGVFDNGTESLALASGQPNTTAVPPSISTPIPTIQNFNPSTCEGTLRFNLAATSDRNITSYSILFNGSNIEQNIAPSSTYDTNTIQFLLDTNYPTSTIATSCAGNSNDGDASVRVNGYMQSNVSCTQYNNVTGALTIDWALNTPSQPTGFSGINIAYSVRVTYSHSNGTVTYLFTDTSNFNLMSFVTTYDVPLTAHNFTNPQGVETNITAHVRILQQCGQDLVGTELSCSLRSVTSPPDIPTSSTTISPSSSIPSSSSSISIPISPTPLVTTNNPTTSPTSATAAGISPAIIGGAIGGIILVLLILVLLLILLGVCIYFVKKRDQEPKDSDRFNMRGFEGNQSKESVDGQPDATYSQVNKPPKPEQPLYADIKKPQKELLYADLEHVAPASGMVKPPTVPSTHYADLAQFSHSEQTTYATVQDTKY